MKKWNKEAYAELEGRIAEARRLVDEDEENGNISEEASEHVESLVALMGFVTELACESSEAWRRRAKKWKRRAKRLDAIREFESVKT